MSGVGKAYIIMGYLFLIIFIFFIINCFTGFYLWKLFKSIFIALPLFIQDLIKIDREVFPKYGFWCYCGLGGSGKTLSMVNYLTQLKKKYPRVKIFTNFDYEYADGKINSWRDLLKITNITVDEISEKKYKKFVKNSTYKSADLWSEVDLETGELRYFVRRNHGVIFGFDEIQLTFDSTNWESAPNNLLEYISQQRKLHKLILSSSQVFTRINKKLREQTNIIVECKSLFLGRVIINKFYNTPDYITNDEKMDRGARKRRTVKKEVFVAHDYIRNLYDTSQIMKELNISKSDSAKLVNIIKNIRENDNE